MTSTSQARLAVDIGGTFTDIVLETAPGVHISGKYLTTHAAPEIAVIEGTRDLVAKSGIEAKRIRTVVHGTTLATNALIERKGAKIALISTKGFRDSLEMAYEHRFEVSDLYMVRPEPLVPRHLRLEVDERLAADGSVLRSLDEKSVLDLVPFLREESIEAVAICLLHSYVDGAHEARVGALLKAALPDMRITLSHEICPEIREFERGSTACANAYVQPIMESYLRRLAIGLKEIGIPGQLMLMMSSGGLTSLDVACQQPIKLVESGPAGGAVLAAHIARKLDIPEAIAFDMGGTTAKLVLIDNGMPQQSRHLEVARAYRFLRGSGMPLRVPVIDLVEIGAGGGSLGYVDALGRVEVGPHSAGSEPGPASYGRGGTRPAVTDADLIMGKIDPETFAGGMIALDIEAARKAMMDHIGDKAGMDPRTSAIAMAEVVDENMANAARVHATDNGAELEGRTMIAFGGAAPMHAARIAQKLGITTVIVPTGAGVGSAHGFLLAPVSYEAVRTRLVPLKNFDAVLVGGLLDEMRREAAGFVRLGTDAGEKLDERLSVYMRYRGQGHEVQVYLPGDVFESETVAIVRELFEAEYRKHFGRVIPKMEIECLTWTLTLAVESAPSIEVPPISEIASRAPCPKRQQTLVDLASMQDLEAGIYLRGDLPIGVSVSGPVIIAEAETNTMVPHGFVASIDAYGNIVMKTGSATE
ncbi:hydantoinase/oxoprolinase family protein [Agrobacterium vitis]|uniref:hydantoinase/oxoprolinase family protein n=1 Tax=Agrobacterium vitis TaxID=373 RepID=UPI0012E97A69|nr:hydantoinase/oxoprolinase family protein [Agrobacterium vitis]MVA23854.1 hydantoinase/oxoprolinase family protein [Agrobacterium vitis]